MSFENYDFTTGMLIKRCRQKAGLSQSALALEVGVSGTTISKWETDMSTPSSLNLKKLEMVFGASFRLYYRSPGSAALLPEGLPVMNESELRCLKAEVDALRAHIQSLWEFLNHRDPDTI